jgi:hypothetical protein
LDPSPHKIAFELIRQLAQDEALANAALHIFGDAPRFYLDDDDSEDKAPHILATPDTSEEGIGTDGDIHIRLVVSAYADIEDDSVTPDGAIPGLFLKPSSAKFDDYARAVWLAAKRTQPGAVLQSHSAEWGYADYYPLLFVIYSLSFKTIQAFGDS